MTAILGLSAFYHDSAAALVVDGRIVAAAQEERFSRIKHDPAFPAQAMEFCLNEGGLTPGQLDYIAFCLHFPRSVSPPLCTRLTFRLSTSEGIGYVVRT